MYGTGPTHLDCVTTAGKSASYVWQKSVVLVCTYGRGVGWGSGCDGRPRSLGGATAVGVDRQGQTVVLAMYTFRVGPWLPSTSVISSGLKHKPGRREEGFEWDPAAALPPPHPARMATHRSVRCTGSYFVPCCVPTHFEDPTRPSVAVD